MNDRFQGKKFSFKKNFLSNLLIQKGDIYPKGPFRPPTGVQEGSPLLINICPGKFFKELKFPLIYLLFFQLFCSLHLFFILIFFF